MVVGDAASPPAVAPEPPPKRPGWFTRLFFGAAGFVCLSLAALAALLPLIPAFPFLAAAVACFAKSSPRFRDWLVKNKWLGPYLTGEGDAKAFSPGAKALTVLILWLAAALIGAFLLDGFFWRCGLVMTVLTLTIQILLIKPRKKPAAAALTAAGAAGAPPESGEGRRDEGRGPARAQD